MEVNSLDALVKFIESCPREEAKMYIKMYGDSREGHGIEKGWKNCNAFHKRCKDIKTKRLKEHVLEYDEENGCIPIVEFIRFFAAMEDELKATIQFDEEVNKLYAMNLHDFMLNKLGEIKTDRRLLFAKP